MDMAFNRRVEQMLDARRPARLDHALLLAALASQARDGAIAKSTPDGVTNSHGASGDPHPLTELLVGGPNWRGAAAEQQGCFSRAEAGRRFHAP